MSPRPDLQVVRSVSPSAADPSARLTRAPRLRIELQSLLLGERPVLQPLSLSPAPQEWTAVVGPNGAGKSTLLRAMAGLLRFQGSLTLDDRDWSSWPARERARHLAWLGQHETTAEELTALDVVMLGRLPHQPWLAPASEADHAAVWHAMQQTQSWEWRHRPLGRLSGGERQRVLLARALAVQSGVLLMDEPLAHLDPPHQSDWVQLVRARVAEGAAIVSVLHELNIALQADRLVVMDQGRIVHQGAPHDPATHAALQTVFHHRLHILQVQGRWIALNA
ncbi:ABC transporter ATP-binding protein [Roseateles sp. SL47]|jgi:iron complex transport system ATP-binding protein|uniref:ABC transporter ATP-binding protein n=1 Tax=Roseateles sp. SL47 TaxID=2995138 RepID=UPI00226EE48F|nr:ABC transporter ATP-binding protein [Roseateles sp. SL47]WAC73125.1 ABC transporter ATP-binding protein [Roseateles sp. SL47]